MSIMEASGAFGATFGPFIGSVLNYLFGYEGPFIVFCTIYVNNFLAILYIQIFSFLIKYIPSDEKMHDQRISRDADGVSKILKPDLNNFDDFKMIGCPQTINLSFGPTSICQDLSVCHKICDKLNYTDPEDFNKF